MTLIVDPEDDPHKPPPPPRGRRKKKNRQQTQSQAQSVMGERMLCFALRKDNVGWRLVVARVPRSTIDNHVIERFEPDIFPMVQAKIGAILERFINDEKYNG